MYYLPPHIPFGIADTNRLLDWVQRLLHIKRMNGWKPEYKINISITIPRSYQDNPAYMKVTSAMNCTEYLIMCISELLKTCTGKLHFIARTQVCPELDIVKDSGLARIFQNWYKCTFHFT